MSKYPFKFYDSYTQNDRDIYFGRDTEIKGLYNMIVKTDILLLFGDSGTGKTSLIQCGLANQFKSYDWKNFNIKRKKNICRSLSEVLKKALYVGIDDFKYIGPEDGFEKEVIIELLKQLYVKYSRPIYLIFDQFEELYLLGNEKEQVDFMRITEKILNAGLPVKIIISMRGEFLKELFDFENIIPQLKERRFKLLPMNVHNAEEVIRKSTGIEAINGIPEESKKEQISTEKKYSRFSTKARKLIKGAFKDSNVSLEKGNEEEIIHLILKKIDNNENEEIKTVDLILLQFFLDKLYLKISSDKTYQKEVEIKLQNVADMKVVRELIWDTLFEQVDVIAMDSENKDINQTRKDIWRILYSLITHEGTKNPRTKQELTISFTEIKSDLIERTFLILEENRILRKSQEGELFEIAHDSLAKQISEKQNAEKISLFGALRIIKAQMEIKDEKMRQFFSKHQLNFIENNFTELRELNWIDDKDEAFIEESRKNIESEKIKKIEQKQRDERTKLIEKQMEIEKRLKEEAEKAREEAMKSEKQALKAKEEADNAKEKAIESEEKALMAKDAAIKSENKAKKNLFKSWVLGIAVVMFAWNSNRIENENTNRLYEESVKLQTAIKERDSIQTFSNAKDLLKDGDSYINLGNNLYACENYRSALALLNRYNQDSLYLKIKNKIVLCDSLGFY